MSAQRCAVTTTRYVFNIFDDYRKPILLYWHTLLTQSCCFFTYPYFIIMWTNLFKAFCWLVTRVSEWVCCMTRVKTLVAMLVPCLCLFHKTWSHILCVTMTTVVKHQLSTTTAINVKKISEMNPKQLKKQESHDGPILLIYSVVFPYTIMYSNKAVQCLFYNNLTGIYYFYHFIWVLWYKISI